MTRIAYSDVCPNIKHRISYPRFSIIDGYLEKFVVRILDYLGMASCLVALACMFLVRVLLAFVSLPARIALAFFLGFSIQSVMSVDSNLGKVSASSNCIYDRIISKTNQDPEQVTLESDISSQTDPQQGILSGRCHASSPGYLP